MSLPAAIFRNDESARQLVFDRPADIIVAHEAQDFPPALEAAQAAHDAGKWLAGYFSYEAGYLLEPKLVPLLPDGRRAPLICLGVFDAPVEEAVPPRNAAATNGPIFDARATWSFEDYAKRFCAAASTHQARAIATRAI